MWKKKIFAFLPESHSKRNHTNLQHNGLVNIKRTKFGPDNTVMIDIRLESWATQDDSRRATTVAEFMKTWLTSFKASDNSQWPTVRHTHHPTHKATNSNNIFKSPFLISDFYSIFFLSFQQNWVESLLWNLSNNSKLSFKKCVCSFEIRETLATHLFIHIYT